MSTKLEAAARQALEALLAATPVKAKDPQLQADAIVALREALAEQPAQQQEPLVTKNKSGITLHVGWDDLPVGTKLYTSPPASKLWVGLTEEEIDMIYTGIRAVHHDIDSYVFARAIEAKLKEKNT